MTNGTGTSTFAYDAWHRLTSNTNGAGQTVSYGYDRGGAVMRAYDHAGMLDSVTDWNNKTTGSTPTLMTM